MFAPRSVGMGERWRSVKSFPDFKTRSEPVAGLCVVLGPEQWGTASNGPDAARRLGNTTERIEG
jgi:hypothetical protein